MNNKEKNKNNAYCKSSKKQTSNKIQEEIKESYKMGIEYYEQLEEHKE